MKITLLRTDLTIGPLEAAILRRLSAAACTPPSVYLGPENQRPARRSSWRAVQRLERKGLLEFQFLANAGPKSALRLRPDGLAVLEVLLKSR